MLDELEQLGGHLRRVPAGVLQIGQDLVVGRAVGVSHQGGVATARRQAVSRSFQGHGSLRRLARLDRIGRDRQPRPLEQLEQEAGSLVERSGE